MRILNFLPGFALRGLPEKGNVNWFGLPSIDCWQLCVQGSPAPGKKSCESWIVVGLMSSVCVQHCLKLSSWASPKVLLVSSYR